LYSTATGNTFDNFTLWNRGGYNVPDSDATATAEHAITYQGSAGSVKVVADSSGVNGATFVQSLTLPDAGSYTLTAYAYTNASAVTSANVELFSGTNTVPVTTYTAVGGGWYKMTATVTGMTSAQSYGVYVHAGQTVYVDNLSLAETNPATSTLAIEDSLTGLGQFSVESTSTLNSGLASLQALIVKGVSGQTADLQDWENSSGVTISSVGANGLVNASTGGVATFVKAGTISDTDFVDSALNGTIALDSADSRLYVREGGSWHYIAFTGGFQIPAEEAGSMVPGDLLIPYVQSTMDDGAVHGLYAKFDDVK
jgi:hypothetical protein